MTSLVMNRLGSYYERLLHIRPSICLLLSAREQLGWIGGRQRCENASQAVDIRLIE